MYKRVILFIVVSVVLLVVGVGCVLAQDTITKDEEALAKVLSDKYNIDVTPQDIANLRAEGVGYTEIVKLYIVSSASGESVSELLEKRKEEGWNTILDELGVDITRDELMDEAKKVIEEAGITLGEQQQKRHRYRYQQENTYQKEQGDTKDKNDNCTHQHCKDNQKDHQSDDSNGDKGNKGSGNGGGNGGKGNGKSHGKK